MSSAIRRQYSFCLCVSYKILSDLKENVIKFLLYYLRGPILISES